MNVKKVENGFVLSVDTEIESKEYIFQNERQALKFLRELWKTPENAWKRLECTYTASRDNLGARINYFDHNPTKCRVFQF